MQFNKELFLEKAHYISTHPTIKTLIWECTLRCNLHCRHCGSDCRKSAAVADMPAEMFYQTVTRIRSAQGMSPLFVAITGGEPLMRPDLPSIGHFLKAMSVNWGIVTNGVLLTPTILDELLHAGLKTMSISLDGLKPAHEWFRGTQASFETVLQSIKLMAGSPLKAYDVITCVNQHSYSDLPQLYGILKGLGVKKWRLITVFPKGRARNQPEMFLDTTRFNGLMEFISHTKAERKLDISFGCEGFLGKYERKVRNSTYYCRAGINVLALRVDGSLSGCLSLREGFDQGNIYQDDVWGKWTNEFIPFRHRSWAKKGICHQCGHFDLCQGNSLHLRNSFEDEKVFCHLNEYQLHACSPSDHTDKQA